MIPPIALLTGEMWAMEPSALAALRDQLLAGDWKSAAKIDAPADQTAPAYDLAGATAVIPIAGVLVQSVPDWMRAYGVDATGYDQIRQAISKANADPKVSRISLAVNSPGGQVSGIHATADAIRASGKPVTARVEGMAASAAYWLTAQAKSISADRGSVIGSIGVYTVLRDTSKLQDEIGIKLELISTGGVKGLGADGRVTDELRAEVKQGISETLDAFVSDIATGRGLSKQTMLTFATGKVWSAAEANNMRLIDAVQPSQDFATMDAFALIEQHPAHAALVAGLAKQGKPLAEIEQAIKDADRAAAHAALVAERDELKARADKAEAEAKSLAEQLAVEKARADKAAGDLAAMKAIADGGKPGAKVEAGEGKPELTATDAQFLAMSPADRMSFRARGGKLV
jgi:signal peptide peptidase SppA